MNVVVLFATLGFTPKLALAPLVHRTDIEEVHLFFGKEDTPEGRTAVKQARAAVEALGLPLVPHAIPGAFDYTAVLEALTTAHTKLRGRPLMVNGSGGSRPMIMAATIFCFTHDVPMVYYDEYQTQKGTEIPLKAYRNLPGLGDTKRLIVNRLRAKGVQDMGSLAEYLHLVPSTVSVHVHELKAMGIVTVERDGKRQMVSLVPEVEVMKVQK